MPFGASNQSYEHQWTVCKDYWENPRFYSPPEFLLSYAVAKIVHRPVYELETLHPLRAAAFAWSPCGKWLLTRRGDTACLWEMPRGTLMSEFSALRPEVAGWDELSIHPSFWETLPSSGVPHDPPTRLKSLPRGKFSPDGALFVNLAGVVTSTGAIAVTFAEEEVDSVVFSTDGKIMLLLDRRAKVVRVMSARTFDVVKTIHSTHTMDYATTTPDGKRMIVANTEAETIECWNLSTGSLAKSSPAGETDAIHVHPSGKILAAAFSDPKSLGSGLFIDLFELSQFRRFATFHMPSDGFFPICDSLKFSPVGDFLAIALNDGSTVIISDKKQRCSVC